MKVTIIKTIYSEQKQNCIFYRQIIIKINDWELQNTDNYIILKSIEGKLRLYCILYEKNYTYSTHHSALVMNDTLFFNFIYNYCQF